MSGRKPASELMASLKNSDRPPAYLGKLPGLGTNNVILEA